MRIALVALVSTADIILVFVAIAADVASIAVLIVSIAVFIIVIVSQGSTDGLPNRMADSSRGEFQSLTSHRVVADVVRIITGVIIRPFVQQLRVEERVWARGRWLSLLPGPKTPVVLSAVSSRSIGIIIDVYRSIKLIELPLL